MACCTRITFLSLIFSYYISCTGPQLILYLFIYIYGPVHEWYNYRKYIRDGKVNVNVVFLSHLLYTGQYLNILIKELQLASV